MKKKTIAVDIDEVLGPWHKNIVAYHNATYGTSFVTPDADRYYISEYTGDSEHVTVQKLKKFAASEVFAATQPITGSVEAMRKLKSHYRLVIITSRHDFLKEQTHQWLDRYFPHTFSAVYFTDGTTKAALCRQAGATILIEDHLSHAQACADKGIKVLLFGDYHWNKLTTKHNNIELIKNWREVTKRLLAE
jgi:5'(3')-deoxyribonucleotidase